jgi:hypothetical protein
MIPIIPITDAVAMTIEQHSANSSEEIESGIEQGTLRQKNHGMEHTNQAQESKNKQSAKKRLAT